ncbi:MAG: cell division protein FtsA [Eubacteriales bacterium]
MTQLKLQGKDIIFALDIGTRNVVGIIGYEENNKLNIIYSYLLEHKTRAMLDGQIHDIHKVTEVIKQLKTTIEEEIDIALEEVAIAAAGRVLKTKTSEGMIVFSEEKKIIKSHIAALEMQGVETAKQMLYDESKASLDYYCVAYSPMKYFLDGYELENLEGHRGTEIRCSIIATFLPRQVVDSLYTAVQGAGLTVSNLTLEPISAINLTITKNLRMLNLSLVDIGAGTSDIAITKGGTITAYGMLPLAGDEFTERLMEEYLIDFNTAEEIKKQLYIEEEVIFTDILGIKQRVKTCEVIEKTDDILEKITEEIARKILLLNGEAPPKAVFCVGGGSQFPKITERLSHHLQISEDRIVVKDINGISEDVRLHCDRISGPEYITPVGICLTTLMERRSNFICVTVNDEKVKLLNTKLLTVMDAAINANYHSGNLIAKNGNQLEFVLNGEKKKLYGTLGIPADIFVNEKPSGLTTQIENNDNIVIHAAVQGEDAVHRIEQLLEVLPEKRITLGEREITIKAIITVNDEQKDPQYIIKNGDDILLKPIETLQDLIEYLQIKDKEFIFYVNDNRTTSETSIKNGDCIQFMLKGVHDANEDFEFHGFTVYFNGNPVQLKGKKEYLFVHIFNFIEFNLHEGKGLVQLMLNGKKASYTDILHPEDEIKIYWD